MNIAEVKESIIRIMKNGIIELYFLVKSQSDSFSVEKSCIDTSALNKIRQAYLKKMEDIFAEEDLSIMDLTTSDDRKNVIYKYDLDEPLGIFSTILNSGQYTDESFSLKEISSLSGFVVKFKCDKEEISLFTKHYPTSFISSSRLFFWEDELRLTCLNKSILEFTGKVDFININSDSWYIFKIDTLVNVFGFHEKIKNVALKRAEVIYRHGLVSSIDKLSSLIDTKFTIAKKVAKICENSKVFSLDKDKIMAYLDKSPVFKDKFKKDADGKLIIDSERKIKLFLKLLNDDILKSELTELEYDVKAKDLVLSDDFAPTSN